MFVLIVPDVLFFESHFVNTFIVNIQASILTSSGWAKIATISFVCRVKLHMFNQISSFENFMIISKISSDKFFENPDKLCV